MSCPSLRVSNYSIIESMLQRGVVFDLQPGRGIPYAHLDEEIDRECLEALVMCDTQPIRRRPLSSVEMREEIIRDLLIFDRDGPPSPSIKRSKRDPAVLAIEVLRLERPRPQLLRFDMLCAQFTHEMESDDELPGKTVLGSFCGSMMVPTRMLDGPKSLHWVHRQSKKKRVLARPKRWQHPFQKH